MFRKNFLLAIVLPIGLMMVNPSPALTQKTENTVDAFILTKMKERWITGLQLAVVQHGKIALLRSYGLANVQDSLPVTNRSIFPIYSCTKAFTGLAIMQLVEEGKVDLAAPV